MRLNKLFHMSMEEVVGLSRQQVLKFIDRTASRPVPAGDAWHPFEELVRHPSLSDVRRLVSIDDLWGAASLLEHRFREQLPGRFFEGATGHVGALLADVCPGAEEGLKVSADRLCEGRFDLLGFRDLSFGDPVDWHLDPQARRRVPLTHWSMIDPFDPSVVGDCTLIWGLNRHQWLITLGQIYGLTGDERYASCFAETVRDWIRTNPIGMGINWVDSAEVSFRLLAWCWALVLFQQSPVLTPDLFTLLLDTIRAHAAHVERYLSYSDSPNPRFTTEALGLFYAGTLFRELRSADRWRTLGFRILVEQVRKHGVADDIYFAQSTGYQRYTIDSYLHFLILADINGIPVPWFVQERLQTMLDVLVALRQPNGLLPRMGDSDGGRLLPLSARGADDCRDVFSVAAVLFKRADYAWAAGGPTPELLWLLGLPGMNEFKSLSLDVPAGRPSQSSRYGGYVTMRSGWENDSHHLIFDVGSLDSATRPEQDHADLLSIQCSAFGQPVLVDPGLSGFAHSEWRDYFRSTAAHSAVMVDRTDQAEPSRLVSWKRMPRASLREWTLNDTFELADADHDAYRRLDDPVLHRRRVVFVKRRYWILIDDLSGKQQHRIDLRFQFLPLEVELEDVRTTVWSAAGPGLYLVPFSSSPLQAELQQASEVPLAGWYAPEYGRRVPAPMVRYSVSAPLPLRIVTLLYPLPDRSAALPEVAVDCSDDGRPGRVIVRDRIETIVIGDHTISLEEV